ncbi:MAG: sulfopyruvate decarboxylase [Chloroflexi bacterium]|nr:sulfopyruvate decarboxylase [Chloroflexota bacterium]
MPVSVSNSTVVYEALRGAEVRLITALPENWLVYLLERAARDPAVQYVQVAREEECIGIVAGAYLAGTRAVALMQNHGFLQAINALVSLAMLYRIPLPLLISDRGYLGERDPWQTEGGKHTRRVLDALGIVYDELREPARVPGQVRRAVALAEASLAPVALLLTRELMWEEAP